VVEASCPVASVALQAASTEQKKSKGAYIPWVGVEYVHNTRKLHIADPRYSDPSLVQDEPPTREEMLEVLAGMRRNKCPRSAPEGGRDKNDGGRGDSGWGTPASQSGGNDNGWSSQPGHVDSTAGKAQINGTGDAQQSPRSWTGGWNEPAHPTRSHPDPQQPSMTPPRSVSGIHPDRLRLMGLAPSSEQSTSVVSASLDEPQHPPAVHSGWVSRNQRGSPRGDFHASTSPPARNGDARGKEGNDYGCGSSYRSRNDQLAGDNWASSSNAPQRSNKTDDAPRVSQGNIWNQGVGPFVTHSASFNTDVQERFEEAPLGATADDDRYGVSRISRRVAPSDDLGMVNLVIPSLD